MLDWLIRNWWRWVGLALITLGLWYGYLGIEIDGRYADTLDRVDERGLEIDKEIQDVEKELKDADFLVQRVRISAKLVKLQKEKSQFLTESLNKLAEFYNERRVTYLTSFFCEFAALLVVTVGQKLQSRWKRWRKQRQFREEEFPLDV